MSRVCFDFRISIHYPKCLTTNDIDDLDTDDPDYILFKHAFIGWFMNFTDKILTYYRCSECNHKILIDEIVR